MNNASIKYLHTSLNITMDIITLLEQVLCTSTAERKKEDAISHSAEKSSNYLNFSVPNNI